MTPEEIIDRLTPAFSAETSFNGILGTPPSTGHCAAVALIVHKLLGGTLVSAPVGGISHWFNRFDHLNEDLDLTGDQFGLPRVQREDAGCLYSDTRVRELREVNLETWQRTAMLASRAGIKGI
jgi:hypothetical protein